MNIKNNVIFYFSSWFHQNLFIPFPLYKILDRILFFLKEDIFNKDISKDTYLIIKSKTDILMFSILMVVAVV